MLKKRFGDKLKYVKSSFPSSSKKSEYVISAELISDCINAAKHGQGIEQFITIRNVGKMISESIQLGNTNKEKLWPPTPQDVIEHSFDENCTSLLYNLLAWIVEPHSSYGEDGTVKLSLTKATKINKICTDIESLVPNDVPSLHQVLLSLNAYRKTGSSNIVNDLH